MASRMRSPWLSMMVIIALAFLASMLPISSAVAGTPASAIAGLAVGGPLHIAATSASDACFGDSIPDCSSTNPEVSFIVVSEGDTSSCTFQAAINWDDGTSKTYSYSGGANGAKLATFSHTYAAGRFKTYTITVTGTTTSGSCGAAGGTLQFTLLGCAQGDQLSGPSWVAKFPDSKSVSALAPSFRKDVTDFIAAMTKATVKVRVITTVRPRERAYLMHWSWLIAKGRVVPKNVPAFVPTGHDAAVNICWTHTDSSGINEAASIKAARQMVAAYHTDLKLKVAPALNSLHTQGLAIDMTTTWTAKKIDIREKNGHETVIGSTPRNGLNRQLIAVGKTYGVINFLNAAKDRNHWSSTGH